MTLTKENDGVMHFRWTNRTSNTVVDDLIVFPEDVTFKRVNTGRNDDRVYMLKWRIGDRRILFWMQDKDSTQDTTNCTKINTHINNPNATATTGSDSAAGDMSADAWMRMLRPGGAGRGQPTQQEASAATPAPSNAFGLDLSRIIQGIQSAPAAATAPANQATPAAPTSLRGVLNPEAVIATGILDDPAIRRSLISLLPEGQQTDEALADTLRSPQLQQAIDVLAAALQSDNFNSVMANLGIDPAPGAAHLMRGDAVGAFLAAASAAGAQNALRPPTSGDEPQGEGSMDETS